MILPHGEGRLNLPMRFGTGHCDDEMLHGTLPKDRHFVLRHLEAERVSEIQRASHANMFVSVQVGIGQMISCMIYLLLEMTSRRSKSGPSTIQCL